uniref:Uncharacterized protein n=1 Tax=Sphaerodactylus townsendi TaxID=933632 RepID=A0ACB8FFY3_9SAUR
MELWAARKGMWGSRSPSAGPLLAPHEEEQNSLCQRAPTSGHASQGPERPSAHAQLLKGLPVGGWKERPESYILFGAVWGGQAWREMRGKEDLVPLEKSVTFRASQDGLSAALKGTAGAGLGFALQAGKGRQGEVATWGQRKASEDPAMAALFSRCLEPVGFLQSVHSLGLGLVAQLQGSATPEERAFVSRQLELLEQELAEGPGLLEDGELGACEDCVAGVFAQLCLAAWAGPPHAPREAELFLLAVARDRLERRLLGLWRRVQGNAVVALQRPLLAQAVERHRPRRPHMARLCHKLNAVLGAGLVCLLCEAGLTQRSPAALLKVWDARVGALHLRAQEALQLCARYFREQAQQDLEQALAAEAPPEPAELAAGLLRTLERDYDWLRWAVLAWQGDGEGREVLAQGSFVAGRAPSGLRAVACYAESPSALDKARTRQLIGDVEWKLPNPPPEVYASLEAEPARASGYLAGRMLQKLAEGLGPGVTVLVVPGKLAVKSGFPPAASLLHEYRHRLAAAQSASSSWSARGAPGA